MSDSRKSVTGHIILFVEIFRCSCYVRVNNCKLDVFENPCGEIKVAGRVGVLLVSTIMMKFKCSGLDLKDPMVVKPIRNCGRVAPIKFQRMNVNSLKRHVNVEIIRSRV